MVPVTVSNVEKRFGNVVALKGVDLEIAPGELFFLLGPSGCGKTTLLRCLAGFYIPERGTIHFGKSDVTRLAPHKRNTGMMFQSYALWPHMTVAENVAFGLEQRHVNRKEKQARVEEALASVRMEKYASRKPNQLSGGQQQRVALARSLVIRPQCLFLDEPLSNLDAKLRMEMRQEIRRVCKEYNLTTIYVTHDQKEALSIADRMAILSEGEILQLGTPAGVYKRPKSAFVADFIGETNFIEGTVVRAGAGNILVKTLIGDLSGVAGDPEDSFTEGQQVTLSIRPECVKLDTYPVEENGFAGKIGESVYYGELAQYEFFSGEDFHLKVFELNPRYLNRVGQEGLYAYVDPDDVVVLSK
ncbi:ABC transporter ATP-binding protein [Puniceicoccales bacterium CK1056]|uniref:ABC transporter ATP-binding protein n=1 Tax=Oceanipulchritudo coccoides TaxID=2706888 RepID=A0A6B2M2U6_9BACT|nr:ABC transporter ATP-binding protein [Oceanipulchritudo coccoides]NDV62434.1 ABC transporter ATP-binding protein [Oceanipulchritudo coccoides]